MAHRHLTAIAVASFFTLAGCQTEQEYGKVLESGLERDLHPAVEADSQRAVVAGNTAFALDMYRELAQEDGNLFCSPYSVSLALAMAYGGARGETELQMAEGMHFTLPQEDLHPAFNWLDLTLEAHGDAGGFELEIANAIWGVDGYPFLDAYLDLLAVDYGAGLRLLAFDEDPEGARVTINDWVADQTRDRIIDLIPPGMISTATILVLTNAIYFLADWEYPFEQEATYDRPFTTQGGEDVTVPTMHQTAGFGYAEAEGYQAVELPYEGGTVSMVLLLPEQGSLGDFEAGLDDARLDGILSALAPTDVSLSLPKFSFDTTYPLLDTLAALGMTNLGDFTGISDTGELAITGVIHKAFVAVDEKGTEAAAATAVVMDGSAAPEGVEMHLDHPFLFLIRDVETGTLLFAGRVVDPR